MFVLYLMIHFNKLKSRFTFLLKSKNMAYLAQYQLFDQVKYDTVAVFNKHLISHRKLT